MSKRKRDKIKAKQARHQKASPQAEESAKKRPPAPAGSGKPAAALERLAASAPHVRDMSPAWQAFYEQMSRAAKQ